MYSTKCYLHLRYIDFWIGIIRTVRKYYMERCRLVPKGATTPRTPLFSSMVRTNFVNRELYAWLPFLGFSLLGLASRRSVRCVTQRVSVFRDLFLPFISHSDLHFLLFFWPQIGSAGYVVVSFFKIIHKLLFPLIPFGSVIAIHFCSASPAVTRTELFWSTVLTEEIRTLPERNHFLVLGRFIRNIDVNTLDVSSEW